ncbi:hypothetical protein SAMN05216350_10344 [Polaromonas sp. YR568]|uniref:hypothetical protein n=1 Tax=Polaromonas sp. YR568 TaxID=1855301 RepID=UPI0008E2C748|nr:hypothetical protein [Polaromonas sp. YR568]SFU59941.1 hypothetical protein SAMN05216350_10344 [Polaromonas sp. YR568]
MTASILEPFAADWAGEPTLHSRAQSWSWFRQAFGQALLSHAVAPSSSWAVDEESLAKAFFSWAELVELYTPYEALDGADFRHFILGLLLQKLLEAKPPVLRDIPAAAAAVPVTSFVLTLLQALHKNAGSTALTLDAAALAGPRWASYVENVTEDASNATCFLDQMTGLQPAWQSRSLIEHRPAMQKALALARQRS